LPVEIDRCEDAKTVGGVVVRVGADFDYAVLCARDVGAARVLILPSSCRSAWRTGAADRGREVVVGAVVVTSYVRSVA
jgi:hypothetical protein